MAVSTKDGGDVVSLGLLILEFDFTIVYHKDSLNNMQIHFHVERGEIPHVSNAATTSVQDSHNLLYQS